MWEFVKKIVEAMYWAFFKTKDIPSPRDVIDEKYVTYDQLAQEVVIGTIKPDVWLTTVQDTNSMDGTIDFGHTMILSNNQEYLKDLAIGDIIVWEKWVWWGNELRYAKVLHQIVNIGEDDEGWYCETRGINTNRKDPYRIRRDDVKWIGLGVIW